MLERLTQMQRDLDLTDSLVEQNASGSPGDSGLRRDNGEREDSDPMAPPGKP